MSNLIAISLTNVSIVASLKEHILLSIPSQVSTKITFSRFKQTYRSYFILYLSKKDILKELLTPKQTQPYLEFQIELTDKYIDFILCDHSLELWLNYFFQNFNQLEIKDSKEQPDFLLHYTHARCCSLLRLGEQERIVTKDFYSSYILWLQLTSCWEKAFFWQLLELTEKEINKSSLNKLAQAILNVERYCRIWGVQKNTPNDSKTRLALFALSRYLLAHLVQRYYQVELWQEL